ncbi:MAG TPA: hypothetical protein VFB16_11945 [Bauldia sp.]|nr:hypothetical protein [Bauldia sp.]
MRVLTIGIAGLLLAACSQTFGRGALGSVSGGVAGTTIARELDSGSLRAAREAEYRALEFGKAGVPIAWSKGKAHGEVTPGAGYRINAYDCRDYTHTITIDGGAPQAARGTACRQANGTWQPVS